MTRLHRALEFAYKSHPKKPALIHQHGQMSYQELWTAVCRWAEWLQDRFPTRTRIGSLLPNVPQAVWGIYGTFAADMIAVPLDSDLHTRNLEHILNEAQIPLVLTSQAQLPRLEELRRRGIFQIVVADQDMNSFASASDEPDTLNKKTQARPDPAAQTFSDAACILYTTGTTGPRKGVILTHANLLATTKNIIRVMGIKADILESLPMRLSHSFGFARLRTVLEAGGTVILENGFLRPEWILHRIKEHRANALSATPYGFNILLDRFRDEFKHIGPNIRYIEIGSDFMPPKHKEQLLNLCPEARIVMHYGLTEASRTCFLDFHKDLAHLSTSGKPAPGVRIRICSSSGSRKEEKAWGEVLVKGPNVTPGYWEQPVLTHQSIQDGWLHTGDQGYLDENGYLHLYGRRQDTINLGGLKVAPQEIEEVLQSYPGVQEAAIVEMETAEEGGIPGLKAYLVIGKLQSFAGIDSLRRYCLNELESYKIPREFKIVTQLPKSSLGKLQRRKLE